MKVTLRFLKICCLTAVLAFPAWIRAQSKELSNTGSSGMVLNMHLKNKTLESVLNSLSKQTGLNLHYDKSDVNNVSVSVDVTNKPIGDVLTALSVQTGLQFTIIKNNLIVSASNGSDRAAIHGTVKDTTGLPLVGVTVAIKGTTRGVQTGPDGQFTLNANPGEVLTFSYIGYFSKDVVVGSSTTLNVVLSANAKNLTEVVVTALGIVRTQQSLTYDQQTVSGKELQTAKDPSFVNSLTGKVAGLTINRSSSGAAGSTKVVLRGNKSLSGDNNVLYVIDGIPMSNWTTDQPTGPFTYNPEGGDAISNLNPDDIESISVLKGASASALYGSQAGNGVILITTKKGKAGTTSVSFSSNTTFDSPFSLPKFQSQYGQGVDGKFDAASTDSWGAKLSGSAYDPKDFFNTGTTLINSLNVSTGTEKNQTFVSYSNTHSNGIQPNNSLNRNNLSVRNTSNFYNNKLSLDVNANYIVQNLTDRPNVGTYSNPLTGLYLFPRGANFEQYKTYETFDPVRNINAQNWLFPNLDYQQNPYWIQYRNPNAQSLHRFLGSISGKYTITDWLTLQARVKLDRTETQYDQELYATTTTILAGANGQYSYNRGAINQIYSDVLLNINKKFSNDFTLTGTLGASLQDNQANSLGFGGQVGNIVNYFNVANLDKANSAFNQTNTTRAQTQSVFANAALGYKNMLFLEATGRNDWASTLAFTNNQSFFYPSVGLSDVLTNMFKMPTWISYAKVRASYSDVGNGIQGFISTSPAQFPVTNNVLTLNPAQPFTTLKPEKTRSFEVGTEWRFFNDQLSFDATYYRTHTRNQLFNVAVPVSTGYSSRYFNAGDVQNQGFEGALSYKGPLGGGLTWSPTVTFSLNRNKIISLLSYVDGAGLSQNVNHFVLPGNFDSYSLEARVGKPYGEIYARDFRRDVNGKILTDATGLPLLQDANSNEYTDVGNTNPNFLLGFNNNFRYKGFDLSFLVDGRFGGKVVDMTQSYLDYYGVSQATADARAAGGVDVNGTKVDAQAYYKLIGLRGGALAQYAYSATNIRLREAALGYTLPTSLFNNKVKSIRVGLLARNLFFFYKKAPYDPDVTLSTGNGLQGIDLFGQPSIRSYGFNVSVTF